MRLAGLASHFVAKLPRTDRTVTTDVNKWPGESRCACDGSAVLIPRRKHSGPWGRRVCDPVGVVSCWACRWVTTRAWRKRRIEPRWPRCDRSFDRGGRTVLIQAGVALRCGQLAHGIVEGQAQDLGVEVDGVAGEVTVGPAPPGVRESFFRPSRARGPRKAAWFQPLGPAPTPYASDDLPH